MTHQIPPNLKFSCPQVKKRKFCLSSNNLALIFKGIFLFKAQLGRKHKSVVKLLLNMFPIIDSGIFSIKFTEPTSNSYGVNNFNR